MSGISRRAALYALAAPALPAASDPWTVYLGARGPDSRKLVVLISGDEEYRSEEALPQLGKILAAHHGFQCIVLYAIDPAKGTIDPGIRDNIPGLEALRAADLMIIATRYRELPDAQMQFIDEYVHAGRPIIGLRTATHAFHYGANSTSKFKHYNDQDKSDWPGGFGKQVLGETWISHHGHHAVQSTRGLIAPGAQSHPILRGVAGIWGPTDVYTVQLPLSGGCQPLLLGEVLEGMNPRDKPVSGDYIIERKGQRLVKRPNDPMMPVAWTRTFSGRSGKPARVFTTTMGAAVDLQNEGFRRMLVNAVYWAVGMEGKIPASSKVDLVGAYEPTFFGFGKHKTGMRPDDFAWKR
ncbi:MAG: ThuA domain-containing protein [Acidobacteriia bacterium]|nr:ThuA domain-containing protein [Terriglobia bacterium]